MATKKRPRKTWLIVLVVVATLLVLFVYSTLGLQRYSCEVCITFRGNSQCRTAYGSTEQEARRTASDNACAVLASGMADSIVCSNTPPERATCTEP